MKSSLILIFTSSVLAFVACGQKSEYETNKIFNEGVSLSLESISAQQKGDFDKAAQLNKKSIEKFREVFKVDSANPLIRSSLGHCLYVDKQFNEAIFWFQQANNVNGKAAVNYRELGLCKINIGQMQAGKNDMDTAFLMDTTKEIRQIAIQDLEDVGELAFGYGDDYIKQGETDKGNTYKKFSLEVLIMAYDYDTTQKQIAEKIAEFAEKFWDKETASYYKQQSTK